MSEKVTFNPVKIDTIVREGVADGKRLLAPRRHFVRQHQWQIGFSLFVTGCCH